MAEDWLNTNYDQGIVSVIIPCHNQERFLPDCIESVIDQEYRPLEIIIVDDGSTDDSGKIANEFQKKHREGSLVRCLHQSRYGAPEARNNGCRIARGEFIQFLDGDDVLSPNKIIEQVEVFKHNFDVDVVYGDGQYMIEGFVAHARKGRVISIGDSSDFLTSLLSGSWVPSFSYLCRRLAVQRCGPWDKTIPINQDFEYFLRMAICGCRFRYVAGISGFYRKHSLNTISEQSIIIHGRTTQKILALAERSLKKQGIFNKRRARAMADSYRRIARRIYLADIECFESSLNAVLRLCPQYLPEKRRARFISSVIGFRNYEKIAAQISHMIYKKKKDWF